MSPGLAPTTAVAAWPPALESLAVSAGRRRQLAAGAMLLPGIDHPVSQETRRRDHRRDHGEEGQENRHVVLPMGQGCDPDNGERHEHAHPRPPGRLRQRPGGRADRTGRRRPDGNRSDGSRRDMKVAGNSRQLGIGPRRKRSVRPVITRLPSLSDAGSVTPSPSSWLYRVSGGSGGVGASARGGPGERPIRVLLDAPAGILLELMIVTALGAVAAHADTAAPAPGVPPAAA